MSRTPSDYSVSSRHRTSASHPLPRLDTRKRNGCLTCRVRRKRCSDTWDETQPAPTYPCMSCQRLKIECLGYFGKRPHWMTDPATDAVNAIRDGLKQFLRPCHQIPEHYSLSFQELYATDAAYIPPFPILAQYAWPCKKHADFVLGNTFEEDDRWDSGSERGDTPSGTSPQRNIVDSVFSAFPNQGASRSCNQQSTWAPPAPVMGQTSIVPTATLATENVALSARSHIQMAGLTSLPIPYVHEGGSVAYIATARTNPLWQPTYPTLPSVNSTPNPKKWDEISQIALLGPTPAQLDFAAHPHPHQGCIIIPNIQPLASQSQSTASGCVPHPLRRAASDYPFPIPYGENGI